MSEHDSYHGGDTPDDPMVVLSDESTGDGHSSPQRENGRESIPDSVQETDQGTRGGSASQTVTTTGQTGVAPAVPVSSSSADLRTILPNNAPAFPAINAPASSNASAPIGSGAVVVDSISAAAINQNNAPSAGVLSGATVVGCVPANTAAPGSANAPSVVGTIPSGVNQTLRHDDEMFTPHPTDPTKMIARFRIEIPHKLGHFYEQVDTIPMLKETVESPDNPPFYFIPNLTRSKVEKKIRAGKKNGGQPNLWERQGTSDTWIRKDPKGGPDHVFNLVVMFRRFNKMTHKYEQMYENLKMLKAADPNTKEWMYAYNKWIDQIRRRQDSEYEQKLMKDHWSVAERRALCVAINAYIRKAGLRKFGSGQDVKIPQADMQVMADAVNAVGDKSRATDAVRSQIFSSHQKKNKCIFDLINRANDLRGRLKQGEKIPRDERYPDEAIPPAFFPKDLTPKKKRPASPLSEDNASELSDVPADLRPPTPAAETPAPAWLQGFLDSGDAAPGGIRPKNNARISTGSDKELSSGGEWSDTDEEILSECGEQARAEMEWATTDESEGSATADGDDYMDEIRPDEDDEAEGPATDDDYPTEWVDDEDDKELRRNLDIAKQRSLQNDPISVGVPVSGDPDSGVSDSASEEDVAHERPVATPLRKTAKSKQRGQASARLASPSLEKKRKRIPQSDEEEGSEGDDEAETARTQGRSIKKTRAEGAK
jgi:hypothetical protein